MSTKVRQRMQCPQCAEKFYAESQWGTCPHCGYTAEEPDDTVISFPAIRTAATGVFDKTYRDMEKASEHRAEMAASMAGVPVSEMSHLKITNLRDNVKPGETYAMPPPAPNIAEKWAPNGAEFAAGTAQGVVSVNGQMTRGVVPRAGAQALGNLQRIIK